jgi:hypothetical protein
VPCGALRPEDTVTESRSSGDEISAYLDSLPRVVGTIQVDGYDEAPGAFIGKIDAVRVDDLDQLPEADEPDR